MAKSSNGLKGKVLFMKSAGLWILMSAPIFNHNRGEYSTRLSLSHCTLAWYGHSFESTARKKIFSSLESPALAGACILGLCEVNLVQSIDSL